ncbi:uncharacterized protein BCR38DRAFT_381075 [Pseudomassariella vexata]|uniref:Uncharacterized protein n=1 Tax=Pseudomassariella vexata TaxID=1141098 RepID=A0A1Y2EH94_9PEZI|nr:uncharacterized protein BCR38DRAFT_381075 [Pseudomassariella vexata]ORY70938.1 hypothetical protein BCR38DRAFT_381075 [Pseudomassariella vexata]
MMAFVPTGGLAPRLAKRVFVLVFMVMAVGSYRLLRDASFTHTISTHYEDLTNSVWMQLHVNAEYLSQSEAELLKRPETIGLIEQHEAAGLSKQQVLSETIRILAEYNRADKAWIRDGEIDQQRQLFQKEHEALSSKPGADALYGTSLKGLSVNDFWRSRSHKAALTATNEILSYATDKPYIYDPYLQMETAAGFVQCQGPDNQPVGETFVVKVLKGTPPSFPKSAFGSHQVLDMDDNLCFERETRLAPYGYGNTSKWSHANWGQLQETCTKNNSGRYSERGQPNVYLGLYGGERPIGSLQNKLLKQLSMAGLDEKKEQRTAVVLRTWTGKVYSENDILVIRSLVAELSLRTGGRYQVFLLIQDKGNDATIWESKSAYDSLLQRSVPQEFVDMSILWNDALTQDTYKKLFPTVAIVHVAQWLPVQIFSQDHPEFDFVWNMELDFRLTGHHYEYVEKLASFAKAQPRRGLWERNERYYIPSIHGDYDTKFRKDTEKGTTDAVWGPPQLPYIRPIGPMPPVADPKDDNFKWGVGEEADMITVGPIVNAPKSDWIIKDQVWGYNGTSTPRRGTIITQSRVSKRLLDIMHVENLRGNHVSSEMTPQTVALHHGLKTVYAPIPVYLDRPWQGEDLERWFNCGFSCGRESGNTTLGAPLGWGREGRFVGSTWYYRADPPERMYRNWMGWEHSGTGGKEWEEQVGRACLPSLMLHPVKNVEP